MFDTIPNATESQAALFNRDITFGAHCWNHSLNAKKRRFYLKDVDYKLRILKKAEIIRDFKRPPEYLGVPDSIMLAAFTEIETACVRSAKMKRGWPAERTPADYHVKYTDCTLNGTTITIPGVGHVRLASPVRQRGLCDVTVRMDAEGFVLTVDMFEESCESQQDTPPPALPVRQRPVDAATKVSNRPAPPTLEAPVTEDPDRIHKERLAKQSEEVAANEAPSAASNLISFEAHKKPVPAAKATFWAEELLEVAVDYGMVTSATAISARTDTHVLRQVADAFTSSIDGRSGKNVIAEIEAGNMLPSYLAPLEQARRVLGLPTDLNAFLREANA